MLLDISCLNPISYAVVFTGFSSGFADIVKFPCSKFDRNRV